VVLQQGSKVLVQLRAEQQRSSRNQLQAEAADIGVNTAGRSSRSLFGFRRQIGTELINLCSSTVQASGGDSRSNVELELSIGRWIAGITALSLVDGL
jgi:hypothetical protein